MTKLETVWEQHRYMAALKMSDRQFVGLIASFTLVGLLVSTVTAWLALQAFLESPVLLASLSVVAVVVAFFGAFITADGLSAEYSLRGCILMAGALGFLLTPIGLLYAPACILTALLVAMAVVIAQGLVGLIMPQSLEGYFSILVGSTAVVVAGALLAPAVSELGLGVVSMNAVDWVIIAAFSAWVVFVMNRAMRCLERSAHSAVGTAAAVYLDFLNLFLAFLDWVNEPHSSFDLEH